MYELFFRVASATLMAFGRNPTIADMILGCLVHNAYRIEFRGESMRKRKARAIGDDRSGDPET